MIAGAGAETSSSCARAHGAHEACVTRGEGWHERVRELTAGRGADVICESVGGEVFEAIAACIAWDGALVVLGFSSGEIPAVKLNRVMLKHIALLGLNLGGYHEHGRTGAERHDSAVVRAVPTGRATAAHRLGATARRGCGGTGGPWSAQHVRQARAEAVTVTVTVTEARPRRWPAT